MMKKDFPIFNTQRNGKDLIYLDSAASAHKPFQVIESIAEFYKGSYSTVHRGLYNGALEATESIENVRGQVAEFIGATAKETIFTHSATEGVNLIAYSYGEKNIEEGDEILVCVSEHHSNFLPWKALAERKGAVLVVFNIDELGYADLEDFRSKLSAKTKIVAIAHQSNVLGVINPIKEITSLAHEVGAKVVVDGAQIIAHQKVDVKDLDADFYVFSGHKMYGPTGVGILYGKKILLDHMDPFHFGGGMVEDVTAVKPAFRTTPHKFEAGTPMIASIIGLGEAISYIESVGIDQIGLYEKTLSEYCYDQLADHVTFFSTACRGSSILTFIPKHTHPTDLAMMLSIDNIAVRVGNMCAQPLFDYYNHSSAVRISLGIYNDKQDINTFCSALTSLISVL